MLRRSRRSKKAILARASKPRGTPTPAPMAVLWLLLVGAGKGSGDEVVEAVGDVVVVGVGLEVVEDRRVEADVSTVLFPSMLERMDVELEPLFIEEDSTEELEAESIKELLVIRKVLKPVSQSQLLSCRQKKMKVPLSLVQRFKE